MPTMYPAIPNSPQTFLTQDITAVQTTIEVADGSKLPDAPNLATIGDLDDENAETILYTQKNGNVLSGITRGFQGQAKAWPAGTLIARYFTAYDYHAVKQNIEEHVLNNNIHITPAERSDWNAKETPQGAQAKADQAEANAKAYTDQQISNLPDPEWDSIQGKPNTFPPDAHLHAISDVEGLQAALDSKETPQGAQAKADQAEANAKNYTDQQIANLPDPIWDDIQNKPSSFPPSSHTHAISDITGLQQALDSKETPQGAQQKADQAETHAKVYTDTVFDQLNQEINAHMAESTQNAHLAKNIGIEDTAGNFTATNVEGALEELFTSVSNGKTLIAGAITDKGVPTSPSDTFQQMADNIRDISIGDYSVGDEITDFALKLLPDLGMGVEIWANTDVPYGYGIAVDSARNVYVVHRVSSGGKAVRKLDPNGNEIWSKTDVEYGYGIAVDSVGNVYVAHGVSSGRKAVRKLDSEGNEIWSNTDVPSGRGIAVDSAGNVYVAYYVSSGKAVRKLDGNRYFQIVG